MNSPSTEVGFYNLSRNAKRLFISYLVENVSSLFATIFVNAFIWSITKSVVQVSLYNIGQFIFLPLGFFLNGIFLRKFNLKILFTTGSALMGLSYVLTAALGQSSPDLFFLAGSILGFTSGFYFSNRNYLALQETKEVERNYFYGAIVSISSLAKVVIPISAGWFIVTAHNFHLNGKYPYWVLFGIAFLLMLVSARIIYTGDYLTPNKPAVLFRSHLWSKRRLFCMASGFLDSIAYFGPILILYLIGNEGVLGTVSSAVAVFIALGLYLCGKYLKPHKNFTGFTIVVAAFLIASAGLALFGAPLSVFIYVLGMAFVSNFSEVLTSSLFLSFADTDLNTDDSLRYAVTFDNELLLNIGRVISIGIILSLAFLISPNFALIYGSLILSILLVILTVLIRYA